VRGRFLARFRRSVVQSIAWVATLALVASLLVAGTTPATAQQAPDPAPSADPLSPPGPLPPNLALTQAANTGQPVLVGTLTTETSQTWANPDGTFSTDIASGPVRVPDGTDPSGWTPIDTTLEATADGFQPAATAADVTFSDGGDTTAASLDVGTRSFDLGWPDPLPQPTIDGDTATYPDVLPGVDLTLRATPTGYEHSFVLNAPPTQPLTINEPLALAGLKVTVNADGNLTLTDKSGKVIAQADPAQMFDATIGDHSGMPDHVAEVPTKIVNTKSGPALQLSPDQAFLTDPANVYPITIDPTVNLSVTKDTYVELQFPNNSYGSDVQLKTGAISSNGTEKARSLIQFGIGAISGTDVTSATLNLWNNYSYSCTNKLTDIYNVTSSWSGPTWNNQPTYGAVYSSKSFAYGYNGSCPAQTVSFTGGGASGKTMTDLVHGWASGSITNYGLSVRADDETNLTTWKLFNSSDAAGHAPVLSVTYNSYPNTPTGLSPTGTSGSPHWFNVQNVLLSAKSCDPDSGKDRVNFEIYSGSTKIVHSNTGRAKVNECTADPWTVNSPANGTNWDSGTSFGQGTLYKWRAQGDDGTDVSQNWSAYQYFKVDTVAPSTPTISSSTHPNQSTWYSSQSLSASWTASSDATSGVTGYAYAFDQNPTWPNPSGNLQTGTSLSSLPIPSGGIWYLHVAAKDVAGNWSTAANFTVHVGGLLSPTMGATNDANLTFSLSAQDDPAKYSSALFEYRRSDTATWTSVPANHMGGSNPLTLNGSGKGTASWDASATLGSTSSADGLIEVRVTFTGTGPNDVFSTNALYSTNPPAASDSFGPGTVNLLTGDLTLGAADASLGDITVSRSFDSRIPTGTSGGIFGPGWVSGLEGGAPPYLSLHEDASGSVAIQPTSGSDVVFNFDGTSYVLQKDDDAAVLDLSLSKSSGIFILTDTTSQSSIKFSKQTGATDYTPDSSQTLASASQISFRYGAVVNNVAPPNAIVDVLPIGKPATYCDGAVYGWAAAQKGCRALTLTYASSTTATGTGSSQWGDYLNQVKTISFTGWDPATGQMRTLDVSSYLYDSNGRLRAEWDPRISPALKTTYDYDASGHVTALTPTGINPWNFTYGTINGDPNTGRALTASRTGPSGTETTTIVYQVPTTTALGGPYQMDLATVQTWGQSTTPTSATAVFPPGHSTADNPPYDYATVHYLDGQGRELNVANSDGASGAFISTTEYNTDGSISRTLSPSDRALVIAGTAAAGDVDTQYQYAVSADGVDLTEVFGPLHSVQLADGSIVQARRHTVTTYGSGNLVHLPISVAEGARLQGASSDVDVRTTTTTYDSNLNPHITTIDPSPGLDVQTVTNYDTVSGQLLSKIMPGSPYVNGHPGGGDARETDYFYFTGDANSGDTSCNNTPEFSGLLCKIKPAAQPSGNTLPVTTFTYDLLDNVKIKTETVASPSATRTTTNTYDAGGRLQTVSVSGPGTAIPDVTYGYSASTGLPTTITAGGLTITRHYDALGRLDSYTDADSNTSTYNYDIRDRPTSVFDGKGTYSLSYDQGTERRGLLTTVTDSQAGSFGASYNSGGVPVSETYPNGMTATTTIDETGAATALVYTKTTNCSADCDWYTDQVVPSIHGQWLAQNSSLSSQQYQYDAPGRLTQVQDTVAGQCTTRQYAFAGSAGLDSNRTSLTTIPPNGDGTCSSNGGTQVSSTYDEADRATKSGYTFDAFGRITQVPAADSDGTNALSLTYFANDHVATLTKAGVTDSVSTDPTNRIRQLAATSATQTWHYLTDIDSPAWIAENAAGTQWTRNILGANAQLGATADQTGTAVLQLTDLRGSVIATASASPTAPSLLTTADQTEFGGARAGQTAPRFGWLGGDLRSSDPATGALLMGVRAFLPSVGRFLQVDPIDGGSANAYDYCNQDPVNCADLSGEYVFSYSLGVMDPVLAFKAFRWHCAAVFPLAGCPSGFRVGVRFTLHGTGFSFPLQVIQIIPGYSTTWHTLPGHPEGDRATVTFRFTKEYIFTLGFEVTMLTVAAYGQTGFTTWPFVNLGYEYLAYELWFRLANNVAAWLRSH
jgi:RHS repeat-associated protein